MDQEKPVVLVEKCIVPIEVRFGNGNGGLVHTWSVLVGVYDSVYEANAFHNHCIELQRAVGGGRVIFFPFDHSFILEGGGIYPLITEADFDSGYWGHVRAFCDHPSINASVKTRRASS